MRLLFEPIMPSSIMKGCQSKQIKVYVYFIFAMHNAFASLNFENTLNFIHESLFIPYMGEKQRAIISSMENISYYRSPYRDSRV